MRFVICVISFALAFLFIEAKAQVHILFVLDSSIAKSNSVFLAGNINGWKPAVPAYKFKDHKLVVIATAGDLIEYKLTAGDWAAVETNAAGKDVSNRVLKVSGDTIIYLTVARFRDPAVPVIKEHTASKNVCVMDTAFYIPQLNRKRTVRIYLPPGYNNTNKRYPVMYMTDGQNCFDEFTASNGEWHVDEALDKFYDSCGKSIIVVAVDNGNELRLQEYDPYVFDMIKVAEGKQYAAFIAKTLKPFIDRHYRTRSSFKDTHVAGSSMGGVISIYCIAAYPGQFGGAGVFSPAFWTAKPLFDKVKQYRSSLKNHSVFFYAGGNESKSMVKDATDMYNLVKSGTKTKTVLYVDELAQHNEIAWSKWFPVYLKFILR